MIYQIESSFEATLSSLQIVFYLVVTFAVAEIDDFRPDDECDRLRGKNDAEHLAELVNTINLGVTLNFDLAQVEQRQEGAYRLIVDVLISKINVEIK